MRTVLSEMTKPYAWFEALAYDTLAAPAILRSADAVETLRVRVLERLPTGGRVLDVGCARA